MTGVARHGKFLDLDADGLHLIFHLARAGWLRWSDALSPTPLRPGKSPIALRCRLSDGSGFDLTEAGTRKRLAAYIVRDPAEVPGIATSGPDPLADGFDAADLAAMLAGRRTQIKGLLRDQGFLAGVGNAYSDEVLHAARLSPFALASSLDEEQVARLYAAAARDPRATPSASRRASRPRSSRTRRAPACACTAAPVCRARCAATPCGRSPSPTPRCSTAPPARPAASRSRTGGCRDC